MMHIACAADHTYVPHCAAMLLSLLSKHDSDSIFVHFLHDEHLPATDLVELSGMVSVHGGQWQAYCIGLDSANTGEFLGRYGRVAWFRVMLPHILPDLERVLYLDADTIIERSLLPFWSADLGGKAVGAIVNPMYPFMDKRFLQRLRIAEGDYFNSGVLLLDLSRWRELGLVDKVFSVAVAQGRQEWPDQNALNVALADECRLFEPKWNAQNTFFDLRANQLPVAAAALREAREMPCVVHFIGPYKPWHLRCKHPMRQRYWHWRNRTPWRGAPLEGATLKNRLLNLLPELWGWRLEAAVRGFGASRGSER